MFSRVTIEGDLSLRTMRDCWRKRDRDETRVRAMVEALLNGTFRPPLIDGVIVISAVRRIRGSKTSMTRAAKDSTVRATSEGKERAQKE